MFPALHRSSAPVVSLPSTVRWLLSLLASLLVCTSRGQDSLSVSASVLSPTVAAANWAAPEYPYNKKRVRLITVANAGGYAATMAGLYAAWYSQYPQSRFHVFNDLPEWQQVDKIGHAYSAYLAGKWSMEMWRWAGLPRKQRIWIGGLSGAVYQTVIETLDGFSAEWGWSWGDIGANILGSGLLIAQELAWNEQRIQFKFSAHRNRYADPSLNQRSNILFGKSLPERILKDYNGQTYWLSSSPKDWLPQSHWPAWLQVSIGTGAEGMFGALVNEGKDDQNNIVFSRNDILRYRQWYLAPDINFAKIKTKKKAVKLLLQALSVIKCPTPGLELSQGKLHWRWIIF
jgi:hypothetical protein